MAESNAHFDLSGLNKRLFRDMHGASHESGSLVLECGMTMMPNHAMLDNGSRPALGDHSEMLYSSSDTTSIHAILPSEDGDQLLEHPYS